MQLTQRTAYKGTFREEWDTIAAGIPRYKPVNGSTRQRRRVTSNRTQVVWTSARLGSWTECLPGYRLYTAAETKARRPAAEVPSLAHRCRLLNDRAHS